VILAQMQFTTIMKLRCKWVRQVRPSSPASSQISVATMGVIIGVLA
jgi:hypothetical protein